MFERISNGLELAKESFYVVKTDKHLLVFPLVSGIACLLVTATFVIPFLGSPMAEAILNDGQAPEDPLAYVVLFAFYFANYFVIVFFNSALVACAIIRFKGGEPTLADGFQAAMNRLPQILGWALVSATIGLILKAIESRSEKVGQIAAGLLGAAWSIGTYFVIPVLVVEKTGPIDAVKRSLSVIRRTWGEALSANFGIGIAVFLAILLIGMPLLIGGAALIMTDQPAVGVLLLALGVVWLLLVSLISTAMNAILLAALYIFAAEQTAPKEFDERLLRNAFAK